MWTRKAAQRLAPLRLLLEIAEGHAQVLTVAIDELHARPRADRRQRRRHERIRRAQHGLPPDAREMQARRARLRPSSRPATAGTPVVGLPRRFEARRPCRPRSTGRSRCTSSISACSLARSRGSKPSANRLKSGTARLGVNSGTLSCEETVVIVVSRARAVRAVYAPLPPAGCRRCLRSACPSFHRTGALGQARQTGRTVAIFWRLSSLTISVSAMTVAPWDPRDE